jgi:hypothetical protein
VRYSATNQPVEIRENGVTTTFVYGPDLLYRYEYSDHLIQWPKAVLVCSGAVPGAVSRRHDVVAVDWKRWVPEAIIEAIVPAI